MKNLNKKKKNCLLTAQLEPIEKYCKFWIPSELEWRYAAAEQIGKIGYNTWHTTEVMYVFLLILSISVREEETLLTAKAKSR